MLKILGLFILFLSFSVNAATPRDNYLCGDNVEFTAFDFGYATWYHITDGQFLEGVDVSTKGQGVPPGCIHVVAGRKSDISNIKWVKQGLENIGVTWESQNMVASYTYKANMPDLLNFGIFGTLNFILDNIEYTCPNVYIGEGSNARGINWWIFSNNPSRTDGFLKCYNKATKQQVMMSALSGHSNDDQSTIRLKFLIYGK